MKINPFNSPAYLIPAFALMSLPLAHAQISFDDGAAGDSNWTSANNWDPNRVAWPSGRHDHHRKWFLRLITMLLLRQETCQAPRH